MNPAALRIGVVGAGNIATLGHIPGLLRTRAVRIVAICDPERARAVAAAGRFGVDAIYRDVHRMLAEARLDAVTVATPPRSHAPVVLAAVRRSLHVLCEKPLATTLAEAERMVEAADRAGVVLAMNMHFRSLREPSTIRAAVVRGHLGTIRYAHIRYLRRDFDPRPGSWASQPRISGGGALADMGPHVLDLALWLAGGRGAVRVDAALHGTGGIAAGSAGGWNAPVEDFASVRMLLDTGVTTDVECGWRYPGPDESRIQLLGDRAGVDVFPRPFGRSEPIRLHVLDRDGRVALPSVLGPSPEDAGQPSYAFATGSQRRAASGRSRLWYRTMADFVAAVRGDATGIATGHDGLAVQRILHSAYRSARSGRAVSLHHDRGRAPA